MLALNLNPFTVDNSKSKKLRDIENGYLKEVEKVCGKKASTLIASRELLIKKNELLKENLIIKEVKFLSSYYKIIFLLLIFCIVIWKIIWRWIINFFTSMYIQAPSKRKK